MAFGKKQKPTDADPGLADQAEAQASPAGAPDLPTVDDNSDDDSSTMSALMAVPAPDEPVEGGGSDALLDMFGAVGIETEDRSALLDLAPPIEMHDLIAELGLVAAAMGIVRGQGAAVAHDDEEELAA